MKKLKLSILCIGAAFLFGTHLYAITSFENIVTLEEEQKEATPMEEEPCFIVTEIMPSFPGGDVELKNFLIANIKYPSAVAEAGIQGKVYVSFIVEKNGEVSNIEIIKSVDKYLDAEAIRVVKAMPKWVPGKQNGKEVRVKYVLPISFQLR